MQQADDPQELLPTNTTSSSNASTSSCGADFPEDPPEGTWDWEKGTSIFANIARGTSSLKDSGVLDYFTAMIR